MDPFHITVPSSRCLKTLLTRHLDNNWMESPLWSQGPRPSAAGMYEMKGENPPRVSSVLKGRWEPTASGMSCVLKLAHMLSSARPCYSDCRETGWALSLFVNLCCISIPNKIKNITDHQKCQNDWAFSQGKLQNALSKWPWQKLRHLHICCLLHRNELILCYIIQHFYG